MQGDDYLIRDFSGSEIHVRVNKDTNMDCATPEGQGAAMSTGRHSDDQGEIPPTSHMQEQMSSGQSGGKQGSRQQEQIGKEIVQGKDCMISLRAAVKLKQAIHRHLAPRSHSDLLSGLISIPSPSPQQLWGGPSKINILA